LKESLEIARVRLNQMVGNKSNMAKIQIFDLCVYFGRIFADKSINYNVAKNIDPSNQADTIDFTL
jgi:hypothetical protein